jgi:pyrimidine operon attenuation protein / uracil phosphoribosyltransferase
MREILSRQQAQEGLERLATEVLAGRRGGSNLALVGIRRGGVPLAEHLAALIGKTIGAEIPIGSVDITLYRDDAPVSLPMPHIGKSHLHFDVASMRIVLVDDVLFTGRTVRAALHALLDYGRARAIELAVLIDRGGRELPIQPDYVVQKVDVSPTARVDVLADEGFRAVVV